MSWLVNISIADFSHGSKNPLSLEFSSIQTEMILSLTKVKNLKK